MLRKCERVISNLLENASKFTPGWRHGVAACRTVHVGATQRQQAGDHRASAAAQPMALPNSVKVSVADTGPGIPAEYHIEVFDDFFRLPQNQSQSEGMGLGLAIARRLVNGMGGKIWVESEPGGGCKFSFYPAAKARAECDQQRDKANERYGEHLAGR